jgi:hypothetical protein
LPVPCIAYRSQNKGKKEQKHRLKEGNNFKRKPKILGYFSHSKHTENNQLIYKMEHLKDFQGNQLAFSFSTG